MITATGRRLRAEKVVLVGTHAAGKTSLVTRFVHGSFSANVAMTVGAAYISKILTIGDQRIQLDIWDTAGSEKYRSLTPLYYRDARAAIIVFDVTRLETLEDASFWVGELREKSQSLALVYGAANKCDAVSLRKVTPKQVEDFAFENQIDVIKETSALNGQGIAEIFEQMAKDFLAMPPLPVDDAGIIEADPDVDTKRMDCPC
jgi:small GTP-binding protein